MNAAHVVARVRAHHAMARLFGRRARTGRLPRQQRPLAIEADYAARLVSIVHGLKPAISRLTAELPDLLTAARTDGVRTDAAEAVRARFLVEQVRHAAESLARPADLEQIARRYANAATAFQREQLRRQVVAAIGVDVLGEHALSIPMTRMLDHFVGENVALIRSVPNVIAHDVDKIVARAFAGGQRAETVVEDVQDRLDIGERHARLIARDQIGKLTGQINAVRQQDLGVKRFRWRTAGDERVREEHEILDGEEFDYDDPPEEGLPGEPIMCRCYAEPVFDEILDAASNDDG